MLNFLVVRIVMRRGIPLEQQGSEFDGPSGMGRKVESPEQRTNRTSDGRLHSRHLADSAP